MTDRRQLHLGNKVESSNVECWGYDPASHGDKSCLAVRFRDGSVYHYFDVPAETVAKLKDAKSVGKFLHAHIYPHHKGTKQ